MRFMKTSRGLTLIELLTVVTLVIVIAAVAIPAVRILTRDIKIREAARDFQVFLADVQSEAKATGSAGIWIERDPAAPNTSLSVYRVTTPPPYSGDFFDVTLEMVYDGVDAVIYFPVDGAGLMVEDPTVLRSYGRVGNRLRLDHKTVDLYLDSYQGVANSPGRDIPSHVWRIDRRLGGTGGLPVNTVVTPVFTDISFEVFPQPVKRSTRVIQLPDDTFLDLSKSGFSVLDLNGDGLADGPLLGSELALTPATNGDVVIMFNDTGAIDHAYFTATTAGPSIVPVQSFFLFLCMDNRESEADYLYSYPPTSDYGTADPDSFAFYKTLNEPQNLWFAFGRNGRISVSENSEPSERPSNRLADVLWASRSIARQQIQIQAD